MVRQALLPLVKHVAVDHPKAIPLAEIFDLDDGGHDERSEEGKWKGKVRGRGKVRVADPQ
jgi:hypothetical protein